MRRIKTIIDKVKININKTKVHKLNLKSKLLVRFVATWLIVAGFAATSGLMYTNTYLSDTERAGCYFSAWADEESNNILCTRTQGYWKTHDEAWPMDEIIIGGETYTTAEAIDWLETPVKGDMTIVMFYHLVPAKLNVAAGCEAGCITDTIAAADNWMATYGPVGSIIPEDPPSPWETGEPLKEILEQYNNGDLCAPHCESPPHEPTDPIPHNDATDVELNPTLSVYVSDPNGDTMDVSFYNASNDSLIDMVANVENITVSVVWPGLGYGITYEWYVIAEDYEGPTQSETWTFTTKTTPSKGGGDSSGSNDNSPPNNPPTADAGGPYSGHVYTAITFNESSSIDSDGTITNYTWGFGDGEDVGYGVSTPHIYSEIGIYTISLTVTDDDGATHTNTTTATITSILEINDVQAIPNTQNIDEPVNITCSITNTSEIVDVILNVTLSNASHTLISIYQNHIENTSLYYYNQTYNTTGTYEYIIWATDIENNTVLSASYNFSIVDLIPPKINNITITPDVQMVNGSVNITADVTDNIELTNVFLNITKPDNSTYTISMNHIDGADIYYYNSTYLEIGEYSFFISAEDTNNNVVTSNIYPFSIVDLEAPEIVDNTPEIAYKNHSFTFNVTVTDNTIVADAYVEYWYETGDHINVSMNNIGDNSWNKTIMTPSNFDILQYIIHAKDTSNNWNDTGTKSITLF